MPRVVYGELILDEHQKAPADCTIEKNDKTRDNSANERFLDFMYTMSILLGVDPI